MPGVGADGASGNIEPVRGEVLYWLYDNGAQPRLGADGQWLRLTEIFGISLAHTRMAVCRNDRGVFVFDMRWGRLADFLHRLDLTPVIWYNSIDEAIVRSMMELNLSDKVS